MNTIRPTSDINSTTPAAVPQADAPSGERITPSATSRASGGPQARRTAVSPAAPGATSRLHQPLPGQTLSAAAKAKETASAWPSARIDTKSFLRGIERTDRAAATQASAGSAPPPWNGYEALPAEGGRPLPPLNPQTVGCYFRTPAGKWPRERAELAPAVIQNLRRLDDTEPGKKLQQLHREITLHWHCLSEAEQGYVLESVGTRQAHLLGDTTQPATSAEARTPVRDWLEHTVVNMDQQSAGRLFNVCSDAAQRKLMMPFKAAGDDNALKTLLKERFTDLRMTQPEHHGYDYAGFLEATDFRVATLDPDVAKKLRVGIVGGGPAGITAGYLLHRMGVKPKIFEQAGKIGGRMATDTWTHPDGTTAVFHPGAMRFSPTNLHRTLAARFDHTFTPFPNPNTVSTTYIIGNEVYKTEPGQEVANPELKKVFDQANAAMKSLTEPIMAARDAGDTALFYELCDQATRKFDGYTFRAGLEHLLAEQGIEWSERDWLIFGTVGIGVGGYKGYFTTSFLEEFRFIIDGRLVDHEGLVGGADAPFHSMIADETDGQSLDAEGAIHLDTEVSEIKKKDGVYYVTSVNKKTGETTIEEFDQVFFTGSPAEAAHMGLTGPQVDSERVMPDEIGVAMEQANIVGATKGAIAIPREALEAAGPLPGNIQASRRFQQMYLVPDGNGGAVLYFTYSLGDNTPKVSATSGEEQLQLAIRDLNNLASEDSDDPARQELANLAKLATQHQHTVKFINWSAEHPFHGAFKMDAPGDLSNTRRLFNASLRQPSDGLICINEEASAEGGFVPGAIANAVNGVQEMAMRLGGDLPSNPPYKMMALHSN
jgi:tryptophan 2-monooxygenase